MTLGPCRVLATLLSVCALAACGGGASPGGPAPAQSGTPPAVRVVPQTDLEIAKLVYAGSPRTPPGFYAESPRPGATYLTIGHLKNSDVGTLDAAAPLHELCTDDLAQALQWSGMAAARAAIATDLVETGGDLRLFEFVRTTREAVPRYLVQRVYKCTYLDRSAVDLRLPTGAAGTLFMRPFGASDLRGLGEYLWTFSLQNNFGQAVLASRTGEDAAGAYHDVVMARLEAGAAGACDRILVLSWRHRAEAGTGRLTLGELVHFTLAARQDADGVHLCTS